MKFDFTWLEDFLALAATGNFTRAAQARHSSQPAFSRRIRALEDWVGTPLVDRGTQPARLSEAGEWFKGVAEELVARTARLPGEARQIAQARSATLRIASTHALSFTFVPRWLRGLESKLTLGPVELASDVLARCEAQMQQGKVQFVLAHAHPRMQGALEGPGYVAADIGEDRLLPVCKPSAAGRPLFRLQAKARGAPLPVLAYTEASGMGRVMREVIAPRLEALPCRRVFSAHLASVLRSMALDGRGIAWLPRTLVDEDLAAGRLVSAADASWEVELAIRLYRPREGLGHAAEAFWAAAAPRETRARKGPTPAR